MENILFDREILGEFVDPLLAKEYGGDATSIPTDVRESAIKELDWGIAKAIFGGFSPEELTEFNRLMDENASDDQLMDYFKKIGIDPEAKAAEAMRKFAEKHVGGSNE